MSRPMTIEEARDLALRLATELGVPAGPVALRWDHDKQGVAKRPLTRHGHSDWTTDPDVIRRQYNAVTLRSGEEIGAGILPGGAGWWVLDLDIDDRGDGRDTLLELEQNGELPPHPIIGTPSGGEHRVLPKRNGQRVGNAHNFGPGVDVRGDDGWVVAAGTRCTWGEWRVTVDAPVPDHAAMPAWVYERLTDSNGNSTGGDDGRVGHWGQLDRSKLHPFDLAALEALERLGGHGAYLANKGDKSYVMIARPGRQAAGVSIGYIGPGVVKVMHRDWWPLRQNAVYDPDWLSEIADAVEADDRKLAEQLADPNYWNAERLILADKEDTEGTAALDVTVVTLDEFAAVDEPGAEALLGDTGDAVIPAGSDVMFYGDGGAGKTTLTIDLGCHLAAGDDWLGITVPRPLTVLLLENEGPRALFRVKLARKKDGWAGSPLGGRVRVVEAPWATLSFAEETHRAALAKAIADHGCDLVMVGPVACSGMTEAGTLAEVRGFLALVDDVRRRSGRAVTFLLVHHPNKAGTPSGAWEGAGDTLVHVQGMGRGRTRLHFQKARWSPTWHARTLELNWTEGESYEVDVKPEISDDDIAASITGAIADNPGVGWSRVEELTPGLRAERRRTIRDRLLADGKLVNIVKEHGVLAALDHCPPRRPAQLHLASDPTITHLRPTPDAAGTQTASPTDGAPTASASLRPDSNRDAGQDADAGEPSELFNSEET